MSWCPATKRARIEENLNLDDSRFDDCWIHVFKQLPFKERILFERVSQKWKTLMPYSNIHSFQLAELVWPESQKMEEVYIVDGESATVNLVQDDHLHYILMSALNRLGPYLTELDFKMENEELPIFRLSKDVIDFLVENAPNLTKLNLTRCLMTIGCFPALLNLDKFEDLDLCLVTIIEEDLSATTENFENVKIVVGSTIRNLTTLKKLNVCLEMAPPVWSPNLTELYINGVQMNGGDVRVIIQHSPNLEVLVIEDSTPRFRLAELCQLHNLRKLSLCYFSLFSHEDLAAFCEGCPNIQAFHLSLRRQMNGWAPLGRLSKLKSLDIIPRFNSVQVTDSVLASVASFGLLETVGLPRAKLTDDGLRNLAENCPNLIWLDFGAVKGISDEGVKHILENCKKLKILGLGDTGMKDPTMTAIGSMGSQLSKVNLKKTGVTRNGTRCLFEEREKRLKNGEKLVKLEVLVNVDSPISKENLEAVSLSFIWPESLNMVRGPHCNS